MSSSHSANLSVYCLLSRNKWTGPALPGLFTDVKIKPEAEIAIFYTADVTEGFF
jgi:DMSO/TMAO reductase YedYZ molybdopterin-dependent catalytic subunit